jgi:hypothetical protein
VLLASVVRRVLAALWPSLVGAALLIPVAQRYRIDAWGDDCAARPGALATVPWAVALAVAIALLAWGWVRVERLGLSLRGTFACAAVVHAIAICAPPFLSLDPLCYAAVGRAMAVFHRDPYASLGGSLPPGDRFLALLPVGWTLGGSAYWAVWNQLCRAVAMAGGDNLAVHLRLYQLFGAGCVFASAALVARAVETAARASGGGGEGDAGAGHAGARAAAFVLFSPLAILEATVGAHNDALLMLTVALFTLCAARGQQALGLGALAAGLAAKASGLLVLGMDAAMLVLARIGRWLTPARLLAAAAIASVAGLAAFLLLRDRVAAFGVASALVGSPNDAFEHCTRSLECLPRAVLRWVVHWNTAAWVVGLAFRAAGGVWLLYASLRGARERRQLAWMACGLFIYYLFLHGFMQAWYLLSLLPLVPHADARLRPAMRVFLVTSLAYYAIRLPLTCAYDPLAAGAKETAEACVVLIAPIVMLVKARARRAH